MNNRDYKEFAAGEYYHVYNRGNGKMDIFRDEQDYLNFLQRLHVLLGLPRGALAMGSALSAARLRLRLDSHPAGTFAMISYCLMPNHFHFLIGQRTDIPISKLILRLATSYSMYFNAKYDHVGHVFQDRFKAIRVGNDTYLKHLSAYIHLNPRTAGLVQETAGWKYSSYPEYIGADASVLCEKNVLLDEFRSPTAYAKYVDGSFKDVKKMRKQIADFLIED